MANIVAAGRELEVFGPYREHGRVWAVSALQQRRWAQALNARLPTPAEFDAIWAQADVQVPPHPRDVTRAPLDALHDDVVAALDGRSDDGLLIAAGKTWIDDGSGRTANYGWHVARNVDHRMTWRGLRVYPSTLSGVYVVQPVGHAHDPRHVDYSQIGYCVRDVGGVSVVDIATGSSVPPAPRVLRRTTPPMVGDDVRELQRALRVAADGVFGSVTEAAVKAYQRGAGLLDDGVVGQMTRTAIATNGQTPAADDWPTLPLGLTPLRGNAERARVFGRFAFVPAPVAGMPEAIRITDAWPARQLVQVRLPQLAGVHGAPRDGLITCHHLVADSLRAMWRDWEHAGLLSLVLSWAGMWCPRFVRGSRSVLSNHAWGTAFDINTRWNGLGTLGAPAGDKGSVRELVSIANDLGWYWGGHFRGRPDPMHFEATGAAVG